MFTTLSIHEGLSEAVKTDFNLYAVQKRARKEITETKPINNMNKTGKKQTG